jgi:hypothetical protein
MNRNYRLNEIIQAAIVGEIAAGAAREITKDSEHKNEE